METKIVPEFIKTFYSEKDLISPLFLFNKQSEYKFGFRLRTESGYSVFTKILNNIKYYLGIYDPAYLSETRNTFLDPLKYLESMGLLKFEYKTSRSKFEHLLLFKDKESGLDFIDRLNPVLSREYDSIEDKIRLNILIGGENEKDYAESNVFLASKYLLKHLNEQFKINYFFRTLEIVKITKQSADAIEAHVRFYTDICGQCHLCGRALDDEFSRAVGIGPTCCKNKLGIKRTSIADVLEASNAIKEIAKKIGVVGPIIIPKSQILKFK